MKYRFLCTGLVLAVGVTGGVASAGPIAHWSMDETAGAPAAIDSVGGADAVAMVADGGNLPVAGAVGVLGGAWSFDGSNDAHLNAPPPTQSAFTTLGLANGGFSYSGWVNTTNASGADTIFSISDAAAGSEEAALRLVDGSLNFLGRHNGLDNVEIAGSPVSNGEWRHVAVTSGPGGTVIYLDGAPDGNSPFGVDIATFTTNDGNVSVNFGANNDNGGGLQWEYIGLIDEFTVYNSVLTPDQVRFLSTNPGAIVPEPTGLALATMLAALCGLRRSRG
ncbi:MAG: LamG domain-containing protein [Phycisphaeraceae bacterium]